MRKFVGCGFTVVLMLIWLVGCQSTSVVSAWRAPVAKPVKKVLVCLPGVKTQAMRRSIEETLVASFPPNVTAVPCYTVFPDPAVLRQENRSMIEATLQQGGYDAALAVVLQSARKRDVYVPPQVRSAPTYAFYSYRWHEHYYGLDMGLNESPGYTYEETRYLVETVLFGIPGGDILWTITTESVNPASREQLVKELDAIIKGELKDAGFVR